MTKSSTGNAKNIAEMRLIESWLDNQTERRYQPAFIQALISSGWTVLHNTRHSPIEIGKDVIARNPEGILYCFQLKGNPGSRLKKSEAAGLITQLTELIDLAPPSNYQRKQSEKHVSVLVTNGEVDEEALVLLHGLRQRTKLPSCPSQHFEVWGRGQFLGLLNNCVDEVWPTTLDGIKKMIEVHANNGRDNPPIDQLSALFHACQPKPQSKMNAHDKDSLISGILVLTEIAKGAWYQSQNHFGLLAISIISVMHCLPFADSKKRKELLTSYVPIIEEHALQLIDECIDQNFEPGFVWAESDFLAEAAVMTERQRLIGICCSAIVLAGTKLNNDQKKFVESCLAITLCSPNISGFYAVPSIILMFLALRKLDSTRKPEQFLTTVASACMGANAPNSRRRPLASPYYEFENLWKITSGIDPIARLDFERDNASGRCWFIRGIMHMLANRNLKVTCKLLWSSFSLLQHEDVELNFNEFCSPLKSQDGEVVNKLYFGSEWRDFVVEGVQLSTWKEMDALKDFSWILGCYIALIPYRASTRAILWLDATVSQTWYNSSYLPSKN